jgi:hypothetical protein
MNFLLFIAASCLITSLLLSIQWIMDDDEKEDEK